MPDGHYRHLEANRASLQAQTRGRLIVTIANAFKVEPGHPYVTAAEAWIAFIAPEKARGVDSPDGPALALHTVMLGFDDFYWRGLCRLFADIKLTDP